MPQSVLSEVLDTGHVLGQLQVLLFEPREGTRHRAALLMVEDAVVVLTTCALTSHLIVSKAQVKVLVLWIDGKLRRGPHIKKIQPKMATRTMALIKAAGCTWRATLDEARQLYTPMVRPAVIYGAFIWHSLRKTTIKGLGLIPKLAILQSKCL